MRPCMHADTRACAYEPTRAHTHKHTHTHTGTGTHPSSISSITSSREIRSRISAQQQQPPPAEPRSSHTRLGSAGAHGARGWSRGTLGARTNGDGVLKVLCRGVHVDNVEVALGRQSVLVHGVAVGALACAPAQMHDHPCERAAAARTNGGATAARTNMPTHSSIVVAAQALKPPARHTPGESRAGRHRSPPAP